MAGFDFEHWRGLAERDPAAFFALRERTIRDFIDRRPAHRDELVALQERIDATRLCAGSPLAAARLLIDELELHLGLLGARLGELERARGELHRMIRDAAPRPPHAE